MEEINLKNILNTYKKFSKRQREILEKLAKTKEIFTFENLQKELQADEEAKELLQKIRLVVNGEYKKASVPKSLSKSKLVSNNNDNRVKEIELMM
ncbi:hypothetical protein [Clostridium beijerinckii]|jgi:hypothetical protein|uniref:Uncharacterized protein n=2 Tax=Clostridium beijerinckii TaxID=1520 RepID=A0A1S8QI55_CLOBE|nr:hypothetical protein [Clostridium beijerinckii]ABR36330.1 hypothetical protein Cbei_4220 [Clostridium beijerinckii NCIMB 8052]AIU05159.1 hypothetical protein Cbs_4220 [Clostridium beijerinckii ATCC 35702]MBF7809023.1 hypothetical protein [Clostridium beijerinckii]NRT22608.1 hypothetical protein [Clostridium beijerinckii]NRT64874.1 hypothetical protein [Clostridium beijerinckii]